MTDAPYGWAPRVTGGGQHWLGGESSLRIRAFNSGAGVVLTVAGYSILPDGSAQDFQFTHLPNTDRTPSTQTFPIGDGWIQHVVVFASSGTPRRGQCYVVLETLRGFSGATIPTGVLCKGYVADTTPIGYPATLNQDSPEGPGVIRSIAGTDPIAGAEISETVPTNARWRLIAVCVTLVADATVANRLPTLRIDDGAAILLSAGAANNAVAASTTIFSWAAFGITGSGSSFANNGALPPDLILIAGYRIRMLTVNFQVGDNYGPPQLLVEEWIED